MIPSHASIEFCLIIVLTVSSYRSLILINGNISLQKTSIDTTFTVHNTPLQ